MDGLVALAAAARRAAVPLTRCCEAGRGCWTRMDLGESLRGGGVHGGGGLRGRGRGTSGAAARAACSNR
eukprot:360870-Chlamydomonas_euryale.AAC.30